MNASKKISILMPTYNDEATILEAIASVEAQTSKAWELIIVNDGSSDGTEAVVQNHIENSPYRGQLHYLYQENQDQLLAVLNGSRQANGDYIYILHSDDLLYDQDSLARFLELERKQPGYDAYTGSRLEINEKGETIAEVKTRPILPEKQALALCYLWLGRNIYMDVAFFERSAFEKYISKVYLTDNMPFWLYFDAEQAHALGLYNMDFPLLRYRRHEGNYINSKLGAANVLSGELRCLLNLAANLHIPAYRLQFYLYRLLNKQKRDFAYKPWYKRHRQKRLSPILDLVFEKAADPSLRELPQFKAVLGFFRTRESGAGSEVQIDSLPADFFAPKGNQMRTFNRMSLDKTLSPAHLQIFDQIGLAPSKLICHAKDQEPLKMLLDYLGLSPYLPIQVMEA